MAEEPHGPVGLASDLDSGSRISEAAKRGDPKRMLKRARFTLENKIHTWGRATSENKRVMDEAVAKVAEHGRKAHDLAREIAEFERDWKVDFAQKFKDRLGVDVPNFRPAEVEKPPEPEPEPPPKEEAPESVKRAVEVLTQPKKKRGRPRKHPVRESQQWASKPPEKV